MRVRGVYRKAYEGFTGDFGIEKMHAKTRKKLKQAMRRRVRRTAENPMDWVYDEYDHYGSYLGELIHGDGYDYWSMDDLMTDWHEDFHGLDLSHWIYYFDWECDEPWEELEKVEEPQYYSYEGIPLAITDVWYNYWIYYEYYEE